MSRIGKQPVCVPEKVKVAIDDRTVVIEGPLGKLSYEHRPEVSVDYDSEAAKITVTCNEEGRHARAFHGLTRALLQNMVIRHQKNGIILTT